MKKFKVLSRLNLKKKVLSYSVSNDEGDWDSVYLDDVVTVVDTALYISKSEFDKKYKNIVKALEEKGIAFKDEGKFMVAFHADDLKNGYDDEPFYFLYDTYLKIRHGEVVDSDEKVKNVRSWDWDKPLSYFLKSKELNDFMKNVECYSGEPQTVHDGKEFTNNYAVSLEDSRLVLD